MRSQMRVLGTTRAVGSLLIVLLLAACDGPGETESREQVQQARTRTDQAVRDVARVLRPAGYEVTAAVGEHRVCGGLEPSTPGVEYRADVRVRGGDGALVAQVQRLAALLQGAGWTRDSQGRDPRPYANLIRDDLRVNVTESQRRPGSLAVEVVHACVEAAESVVDGLLGEEYRILSRPGR